jgi:ribosome maturation factor RimP
LAPTHDKERQLTREITPKVEGALPGTEVLAVELTSPERFTVFVDHVQGVDHALCERVTSVLRDYLGDYSVDVSSPGLERPLRKPAHFRGRRSRRHRRDQRQIRRHPV